MRAASCSPIVVLPEPDTPITISACGAGSGGTGILRQCRLVDQPYGFAVGARAIGGQGLTREDAELRMAAQTGRDERHELADVIIDNRGDLDDLALASDRLWHELVAA